MVIANLDRKNRLVTMFVDHLTMTFVVGFFVGPVIVMNIIKMEHMRPLEVEPFRYGIYEVFAFSLYFCKDIYLGRSVAKRILGFQVVNNATGQPAGPLRCLVRNFTLLLWPVEMIVALVLVNRRIGDYLAGTRLVVYDPKVSVRPDWGLMAVCIPLSMVFTYVCWFYPMDLFLNFFLTHQ